MGMVIAVPAVINRRAEVRRRVLYPPLCKKFADYLRVSVV